MLARRLIPVTMLVLAAMACGGSDTTGTSNTPPQPQGDPVAAATIQVQDNIFSPSTVLISAGGTVTWTWAGVGQYSVTAAGNPVLPQTAPLSIGPKTLGPVVFATAGTYSFYCLNHGVAGTYGGGQMTGAVFVQ